MRFSIVEPDKMPTFIRMDPDERGVLISACDGTGRRKISSAICIISNEGELLLLGGLDPSHGFKIDRNGVIVTRAY